jgi:hypothetical protein
LNTSFSNLVIDIYRPFLIQHKLVSEIAGENEMSISSKGHVIRFLSVPDTGALKVTIRPDDEPKELLLEEFVSGRGYRLDKYVLRAGLHSREDVEEVLLKVSSALLILGILDYLDPDFCTPSGIVPRGQI